MANLFEQGKQKFACSLNNVWLFWEYSGLTLKAVASGSTKWAENKEIKIHTFPHIQAEQGKIERDKHWVPFIYLVVNESHCGSQSQHGPWIVFQRGEAVFA